MRKLFTRADLIIVLVVLILGVSFLLLRSNYSGKTAIVRVDGKEYRQIDLTSRENVEFTVNSVDIVYKNGEVFIKESSCRDKICVNAGHLSKSGQSAVCAPNRVSVEISGKGEKSPWAVTG